MSQKRRLPVPPIKHNPDPKAKPPSTEMIKYFLRTTPSNTPIYVGLLILVL